MDDDEATEVDDKNAAAGFDPEKLRVYELRKLKYYFAVLECDSAEAAETIYRWVRKRQRRKASTRTYCTIITIPFIPLFFFCCTLGRR